MTMQMVSLFLMLRRAALPALCLLVAGYFLMHALLGPTGYLALDDIRAEYRDLQASNADLRQQTEALERDIALLDPYGADRDFADELIRRHLGVIRPDELIVPLPRTPAPESGSDSNK